MASASATVCQCSCPTDPSGSGPHSMESTCEEPPPRKTRVCPCTSRQPTVSAGVLEAGGCPQEILASQIGARPRDFALRRDPPLFPRQGPLLAGDYWELLQEIQVQIYRKKSLSKVSQKKTPMNLKKQRKRKKHFEKHTLSVTQRVSRGQDTLTTL